MGHSVSSLRMRDLVQGERMLNIRVLWIAGVVHIVDLSAFIALSRWTRDIQPMLLQCWASVEDGVLTLKRHWMNAPCYAVSILGQSRRRWANIETAMGECPALCCFNVWPGRRGWATIETERELETLTNVCLFLGQRRRRWASIRPESG